MSFTVAHSDLKGLADLPLPSDRISLWTACEPAGSTSKTTPVISPGSGCPLTGSAHSTAHRTCGHFLCVMQATNTYEAPSPGVRTLLQVPRHPFVPFWFLLDLFRHVFWCFLMISGCVPESANYCKLFDFWSCLLSCQDAEREKPALIAHQLTELHATVFSQTKCSRVASCWTSPTCTNQSQTRKSEHLRSGRIWMWKKMAQVYKILQPDRWMSEAHSKIQHMSTQIYDRYCIILRRA